jgi:hypothetical protein
MLVTVLAITDNGDGTYNVQFSEPVAVNLNWTSYDNLIAANDTAYGNYPDTSPIAAIDQWQGAAVVSAETLKFSTAFNAPGDLWLMLLNQPKTFAAVSGHQFATNVQNII